MKKRREPGQRQGTASEYRSDSLSWLLSYITPHRPVLILSFILSAVSTGLGMIQPYFAKLFIDEVFLGGKGDLLMPLLLALLALLGFSFFIRVGNKYIYTRYSARMLFTMREDLFSHLQRIPLGFFADRKIGDIYSRIASDMAEIQGMLTETVPMALFNGLTCLITAAILFHLHPAMALMSVAFTPAAVWLVYRLRPRLLDLSRRLTESNADISHFLLESLGNMPLIRAFGAQKATHEKLQQKQAVILTDLLRYQVLGAWAGAVPTLFVMINTVVVFGYGGRLVLEGGFTVGALVAFSIYQARVLGPLQGLMDGYLALQKSRISLQRVREILDVMPEWNGPSSQMPFQKNGGGEIRFENVSFSYDGRHRVLENLSLTIPGRKVTALSGESGAGKTTICHLAARLFDPDAGAIRLDGADLRGIDPAHLRRRVALVSQEIFLFHAQIRENIRFARPDASDEEIRAAAAAACIDDFIRSLPEGYETVIGDRGVRLSGGQKQRISIARAALIDPDILILDEATAFLDTEVESRLRQTLSELMKDRTILLVSHRESATVGADHRIRLSPEGKVL